LKTIFELAVCHDTNCKNILNLNPTDQAIQASSISNEDTRFHEEAEGSAEHRNLLHKDQELSLSVRSSAANLGFFLNATPERQKQTSGYSSPSESLHTVVTYNTSFRTSQERMEFALKV
jgi:hypothetical protein